MDFLFDYDSDSDTEYNYGSNIDLLGSLEHLTTNFSTLGMLPLSSRRPSQARPHNTLLGRTKPSGRLRQPSLLRAGFTQSSDHVPQVCYRHNSRAGCVEPDCRRLHLCSLFLADICNFGPACRKGHSLTTVHNRVVCDRHGLDTSRELVCLQKLRCAAEEKAQIPDEVYHKNLERCFRFGSADPCDEQLCSRLHICRNFIAGNCTRRGCKFGHDLHTTHNNGVLSRHKVTKMSDAAIIVLLNQKYPAPPQQSTTAATAGPRAAGAVRRGPFLGAPQNRPAHEAGGAIPRRPTRGGPQGRPSREAGRAAQPDGGLAEELQCPVCLDMFRRPTTLGCGHTLCQGCLDEVRELGGDGKCPMCRTRITSASRSVALENIIRNMAGKR